MKTWLSRLGPLAGLVAVVILFSALRPAQFANAANAEIMLLQTAVVATAALGMTLVIVSGGIDLSVGAQIALATVTLATLVSRGWSPAAAAVATVICGAACGCLIGGLVTGLRLSPFIVTLGMWGGLRGLAKGLAGETMVAAPTTWLNDLLTALPADRRWLLVPPGVWLTLLLAAATALLLQATRFGRHLVAIGSNEPTARLCGVAVDRVRIVAHAVASALAAVAGLLQYAYLTVGDPTTAMGMELDVIAAVVIGGASLTGGRGSIAGTLVGAMIMTAVANGCTKLDLPNWVQEIVTGVIIVSAVALDRARRDAD
ncbi:MAG: ABC transporter permease [Planctomycetaceae bacterium]|jgi:ribose transport system permease protein|nr:ABC transporter permease [Planctomycetaceae bacterium]